ncbi:large-conductance mechanosensitive channel [Micromonospora sonchi]|uniref:Large-conductance mechanosensitive channel n=1 Tax=Micromonospora sonchi TaxID=1763543 RepID=A0A917U5U8_9ACTN|nr:large conductance mechanosensitive channel protein MscL [Micromonospora sonchi]GGM61006.1 large-conductance mechanosensitive channel [Micromonospora sonchi]
MLKGFKDFIMRGNVVDLAVGIVIGAAFTGLVTAFTSSFLQPIINLVGASPAGPGARFELGTDNYVTWGAFINALITFLLTAAALYFLVVFPMNKLAERRRRGEEPPPAAPSEEIKLLTEIRDALVAAGRTTLAQQRGALDDVLGHREEPPSQR